MVSLSSKLICPLILSFPISILFLNTKHYINIINMSTIEQYVGQHQYHRQLEYILKLLIKSFFSRRPFSKKIHKNKIITFPANVIELFSIFFESLYSFIFLKILILYSFLLLFSDIIAVFTIFELVRSSSQIFLLFFIKTFSTKNPWYCMPSRHQKDE